MDYEPLAGCGYPTQPLVRAILRIHLLCFLWLRCRGEKELSQCNVQGSRCLQTEPRPFVANFLAWVSHSLTFILSSPLIFSRLRKLTLASTSTTSSALPVYTPPPPHYQPPSPSTTCSSPDDKGFVPLASAGAISEFTISAYEKPLDPEFLTPRVPVGSLSSRASSTSVVDYSV